MQSPITHLKLQRAGKKNAKLFIWVNHQLAGKLVLDKQEIRQVLACFTLKEPDNKCPLRSYWGGDGVGTIVYANEPDLPKEMQVISRYGELLTVAQVKARQGANRKDGLPTELLGFGEG